jgi:hypothetical protein
MICRCNWSSGSFASNRSTVVELRYMVRRVVKIRFPLHSSKEQPIEKKFQIKDTSINLNAINILSIFRNVLNMTFIS